MEFHCILSLSIDLLMIESVKNNLLHIRIVIFIYYLLFKVAY